jgi:diguanylate cyclase (GGDEF)-like protein
MLDGMVSPSRPSRAFRWEELVGNRLRRVGLEGVRRKILVFTSLAVLIPALSTAWMSYVQNRRSLTAKVAEGLARSSAQAQRELDLWIKERLYDAKVYTGSYEVTENLGVSARAGETIRRLDDYLRSVRTRSLDFVELQVATLQGRVIASSAREATDFRLPDTWVADVGQDKQVIGTPFWDADIRGPVVPIAVAVKSSDGRVLGALSAKLSFGSVDSILQSAVPQPSGALYVVNGAYGVIVSSGRVTAALMESRFDSAVVQAMVARQAGPVSFRSPQQGIPVVGTIQAVPRLGWYVVAQLPEREAFAQVRHLRNVTVLTVLGLLVVLGVLGYVLAQLIIRPLNRLTQGATEVAAGNLDVDLKAVGGGEVGSLVEAFNGMVEQLRHNRAELAANNELLQTKNEELEHLAITDALTGLFNRRHLIAVLTRETLRARRHETHFAVLMLDVDQFKRYNDTFGHQAGDDVLVRVAVVLGQTVREGVDVAGRYGGEEFLVLLPETRIDEGERAAERIRSFIENEFWGPDEPRQVTISIGVAAYPGDGETPETLIASADAAMYRAKQRGRNRVERAAPEKPQEQTKA